MNLTPPRALPLLLGYSGGLDSTVLLTLLAHRATAQGQALRAIHVHHGLHPEADHWARHCQTQCAALSVPLTVVHVTVAQDSGLGLEAAARTARHAAFVEVLQPDEILVLAHHQDDQAETLLLRALRGASVDGLAAMRAWRRYAQGWLWRPLLQHPREHLQHIAQHEGLRWIDDPSNADPRFDRNFLRQQLMPLLRERWPHAADAFARSAALCAEAADLLQAADAHTLASARVESNTLTIDAILPLPDAARARLLRYWVASLALPPLPANGVACIQTQLLQARSDAQPCFDWAGARIQRWRGLLHAGQLRAPLPHDYDQDWDGSTPLHLPTGDVLHLRGAAQFDTPLRVQARRGGERIRLPNRQHSHALKHVLQDAAMPPWERQRLPLLFDGDRLLAAGDRLLSAHLLAWLQTHHAQLEWNQLA